VCPEPQGQRIDKAQALLVATHESVLAGVESAMIGSFAQTPDRHKLSLSAGS
jgi:hypothetical protein